jgi:hypothetical protein
MVAITKGDDKGLLKHCSDTGMQVVEGLVRYAGQGTR